MSALIYVHSAHNPAVPAVEVWSPWVPLQCAYSPCCCWDSSPLFMLTPGSIWSKPRTLAECSPGLGQGLGPGACTLGITEGGMIKYPKINAVQRLVHWRGMWRFRRECVLEFKDNFQKFGEVFSGWAKSYRTFRGLIIESPPNSYSNSVLCS